MGQRGAQEIDFVAERRGERFYVQVAYLLESEETRAREFGNLLAIPDQFPKYVLSMDKAAGGSVKGVRHLSIREFVSS